MPTALPRWDSNKIPIGHRGGHTVLWEVCTETVCSAGHWWRLEFGLQQALQFIGARRETESWRGERMAPGKAGWRGPGIRAQRERVPQNLSEAYRVLEAAHWWRWLDTFICLRQCLFIEWQSLHLVLVSERVFLKISGVSQKTGTQTFFLYSWFLSQKTNLTTLWNN